MAETRPLRVCDLCGQVDDHPRALHLFGAEGAPPVPSALIAEIAQRPGLSDDVRQTAIEELLDPRSAMRHHDCCAQVGCPAGTCGTVLQLANAQGKTGDDLRKAITRNADKVNAELERRALAAAAAAESGV